MATNYSLMKESQNEILERFYNFYTFVLENQHKLFNQLKEKKQSYEEIYNQTVFLENQANNVYSDILEECMWIIQKDQPRAAHLRFVIAAINSIKDIERISDHSEIISEYFLENDFDSNSIDGFLESFNASNQALEQLFNYFKNKVYSIEVINDIKQIRNKYMNKSQGILVKLLNNYDHSDENAKQAKMILMFRHIERNIDHAINIIQNFGNVHITSK